MVLISRLTRTLHSCRTIASVKTLNPGSYLSQSPRFPSAPPLCDRILEQQKLYAFEAPIPKGVPYSLVHTFLAGLLGFGSLNVAFADEAAAEAPPLGESAKTPPLPESALPESSPAVNHKKLEDLAMKEKARLEEILKSKGGQIGSYLRCTVSIKGQEVSFKFLVRSTSDMIPLIIANLVSHLGVRAEDAGVGSDMTLRAWDRRFNWKLMLRRPKPSKNVIGDKDHVKDNSSDGDFCILISCPLTSRPLTSSDRAEIEFIKQGSFTSEELNALASILQLTEQPNNLESRSKEGIVQVPTVNKTISDLEAMGVKIYGIKPNSEDLEADISWENIAGYDEQKRDIEDNILLALKSPDLYDEIARGTRTKFETNRPRAVLFEGPPGTGKTSCARVIANQVHVPLLHVPLEIVVSKYYGESERLLAKVFSLANELNDGAIIFLDEIDSFATTRDSDLHEATRRMLSVLLRQIDGFEQEKKVVVIAATNRKQDLDPALLSRFDSMITFNLPDQPTREAIIAQYAKHLTKTETAQLAAATIQMSGRDIKDVCQQAERHWASKIARAQGEKKDEQSSQDGKKEEQCSLPPLRAYIDSTLKRQHVLLGAVDHNQNPHRVKKIPYFDYI